MGMKTLTPPWLGFGAGMENSFIFWNKNGIRVPHSKPVAPLLFLNTSAAYQGLGFY